MQESGIGGVDRGCVFPLGGGSGSHFIRRGIIPENAADKSGLAGGICQKTDPNIPKTTFGGFGSALAYTPGLTMCSSAVPDRGPFDGRTDVPYLNCLHFVHITPETSVNPNSGAFNVAITLLVRASS